MLPLPNGMSTLPNTETDKKWVVKILVQGFNLHRGRYKHSHWIPCSFIGMCVCLSLGRGKRTIGRILAFIFPNSFRKFLFQDLFPTMSQTYGVEIEEPNKHNKTIYKKQVSFVILSRDTQQNLYIQFYFLQESHTRVNGVVNIRIVLICRYVHIGENASCPVSSKLDVKKTTTTL